MPTTSLIRYNNANSASAKSPNGNESGLNNGSGNGAHPSSEGKRKRNRSNVEAMTAKHFDDEAEHKTQEAAEAENEAVNEVNGPADPQENVEKDNGKNK